MKKRIALWIVIGLATVLTLLMLLVSVAAADTAEQDVEQFITEHKFLEGLGSARASQLSQTYTYSIHYYRIDVASTEQEEAAFEGLRMLTERWNVRNEDEFGVVYVNDRSDSTVYSAEMRREFVSQVGLDGRVTKSPGPMLLLAIGRDEPVPATLWRKIIRWLGL